MFMLLTCNSSYRNVGFTMFRPDEKKRVQLEQG